VENYFKFDCAFMAPPRFLETDLLTVNATACLKRIFKGKFNGEYLILNINFNINLILYLNKVVAIKSILTSDETNEIFLAVFIS